MAPWIDQWYVSGHVCLSIVGPDFRTKFATDIPLGILLHQLYSRETPRALSLPG